jgi:rod shape determining protein RodA
LLVAVLLFGKVINGTRGWFAVAGLGIQPVEIVKLFLIIFWARYFSSYARGNAGLKTLLGSGAALMIIVGLVVAQPDFGSALLLMSVWGALLLLAGVRRSHLAAIVLIGIAAADFSWVAVLKPYQKDRIMVFLDPSRDPRGRGYQVTQSIIAIGSGGLTGKGLGSGSQSQLRFLPERQTDFLFAALAEDLGFVGVMLVLSLFFVIMYRGYALAIAARDDFSLFLILGILASFAVEIVVNIGGNLGLLPITGIALPFLSYGGSALLSKFLMIGVLEAAAVQR